VNHNLFYRRAHRFLAPGFIACLLAFGQNSLEGQLTSRQRLSLDFGWRFHLGDQWGLGERLDKAGMSSGPASATFSDAAWRVINVPHDWVAELPFDRSADVSHGFKPVGPGFPQNSIGWYRRAFDLPVEDSGKRLWIEFDGVFRDCRVFFNGYFVGRHESGYGSFRYDVTDLANCGGRNTLAVRVDASQFEGWFYEGAGIYRHVWLEKTAPVAIAPDGVFVYAEFSNNIPNGPATVRLKTQIQNLGTNTANVAVAWAVVDSSGTTVAECAVSQNQLSVPSGGKKEISQETLVASPKLWSPEQPQLYKLVTTVKADGAVLDGLETEFGFRTVAFDADKGFLLNGKPYVIKGTCNHQDHAGVGSALPDALQYFRIRRLKQMGCNAVRTSHNPPTPEWLQACDRLGLLVMDENRLLGSDPANLGELAGQICRDRNHASVFIWSLFNEELRQGTETAARIAATMQRLAHSLDPTRLCTAAANEGNVYVGVNHVLDVRGWNYFPQQVDRYHKEHPGQPNIGTEQASAVGTRGIYANDAERGYVSAYDTNAPPWATTAEKWWTVFADRPWLSGAFVWTGFDYRGEPTPYSWPCINSHFGILDTCGFPKDDFYYYQAWWSSQPVLHLFPHWNWTGKEGQEIDVRCFSNCQEVELFLNGESLGRQPIPHNSHARWNVKYTPGVLLARGYYGGKAIAEDKVETTGAPARLELAPDRSAINADGEDVSVVTVSVTDEKGRIVPVANNLIRFDLQGPGKIVGVGNGDPSCHEPDVYVTGRPSRVLPIVDWRFKRVADHYQRSEVEEDFDDAQWAEANVRTETGPLNPGESAVFRAKFNASSDMLSAPAVLLSFGTIDDDGWVYINGHFVGESHDWTAQPCFDIHPYLHSGDNVVAVAVKNREGAGGLNRGVSLEIQGQPLETQWRRSVFNGLAQVIVQSSTEAGHALLTATAEGLASASANLSINAAIPRPTVLVP
jgi:beta-galactosidase